MIPVRIVLALLVCAAACNGDDPSSEATATTSTGDVEADGAVTPATGSWFPPGDIDGGLQPWIDDATADLAARLGVEASTIEAVSAVLVEWPDSSLGCPAPGTEYDPTATDGAVIELGVGGDVYRYHAGGSRTPFACATPSAAPPARL